MYLCGFTREEVIKGIEKINGELNAPSILKILRFILWRGSEKRIDGTERKISAVFDGRKRPANLFINVAEPITNEAIDVTAIPLIRALRLSMGGVGGILPKTYGGSYAAAFDNRGAGTHPLRERGIKKIVVIGSGDSSKNTSDMPHIIVPEFANEQTKLTPDELINIGYESCKEQLSSVLYKIMF
jgi:hypothetical protein